MLSKHKSLNDFGKGIKSQLILMSYKMNSLVLVYVIRQYMILNQNIIFYKQKIDINLLIILCHSQTNINTILYE
jgi:hypothetical protein